MAKDETTSGLELFLAVSRGAGVPLRSQLQEGIRTAIRKGVLVPGTWLPSSRALSRDLGLSRGVVVEAYDQLAAEGYLSSARGSGTRVAAGAAGTHPPSVSPTAATPPRFDFRPGLPDLSLFPRAAWLAALRRVLAEAPDAVLGYGVPEGPLEARQELLAYLGRVRGVLADPSDVVVCSGLAQGLALVLRVLGQRGIEEVAVEDPGWPRGKEFILRAGFTPVPIAVDGEGLRVDQLAGSGVRAVMVTPAHQFPTGVVLSPARRGALVEWARACDGIVIEDDYDAEFRYDREPVGALQGLAPDRVVYGGSVSKTLVPALRLAWLVVPPQIRGELVEAKYLDDRGSPALDQLTLARFISSGALDRHRRRCRAHYRHIRDRLVATLRSEAPEVRVEGIAAGLHLLAWLAADADESALVAAGARHSVRLYGLADYTSPSRPRPPALVVGYGGIARHSLDGALDALADALAERAVGAPHPEG